MGPGDLTMSFNGLKNVSMVSFGTPRGIRNLWTCWTVVVGIVVISGVNTTTPRQSNEVRMDGLFRTAEEGDVVWVGTDLRRSPVSRHRGVLCESTT